MRKQIPNPTTIPAHPRPTTPANSAFRIHLVPHLDSRRSLRFDAITPDLRVIDPALRIGLSAINALGTNKPAFKVVSRVHAEIRVEKAGKFYINDTKSSSGGPYIHDYI